MCLRASGVTVPEELLKHPELIEAEAKELREDAWNVLWSQFRRDGEHHKDD